MKKLLLSLLVVAISLTQLMAQESSFSQGDKVVNLGVGFGSTYYASYYSSHTPALSASVEVGVVDGILEKGSIGIGGYVGYSSAKWANYYKTSNIIVGGRGSFHYPLVDKLDTYTGLLLGYNIYSYTYDASYFGAKGSAGTVTFAWFAGARYYFSDNFGVLGEIGYGIAYLTVGVSLKF